MLGRRFAVLVLAGILILNGTAGCLGDDEPDPIGSTSSDDQTGEWRTSRTISLNESKIPRDAEGVVVEVNEPQRSVRASGVFSLSAPGGMQGSGEPFGVCAQAQLGIHQRSIVSGKQTVRVDSQASSFTVNFGPSESVSAEEDLHIAGSTDGPIPIALAVAIPEGYGPPAEITARLDVRFDEPVEWRIADTLRVDCGSGPASFEEGSYVQASNVVHAEGLEMGFQVDRAGTLLAGITSAGTYEIELAGPEGTAWQESHTQIDTTLRSVGHVTHEAEPGGWTLSVPELEGASSAVHWVFVDRPAWTTVG